MYCDFCGRNLSYNVKYCRYCGRHLKDGFGDTQPLPAIDEVLLKDIEKKMTPIKGAVMWKVVHCFFSLVTLGMAIYIVMTFKTVKEYQILIGGIGSLAATYIWWRGY